MTDIKLIDVSLRDGNQSIWGATGVTTRTIRKMSPLLDRCGYHAIELLSSTLIAVAVRFHREDPWARLDIARRLAPSAKLGFLTTGKRFITFSKTPAAILRLAYGLLSRHGVTRMWVVDPMLDMASTRECQGSKRSRLSGGRRRPVLHVKSCSQRRVLRRQGG